MSETFDTGQEQPAITTAVSSSYYTELERRQILTCMQCAQLPTAAIKQTQVLHKQDSNGNKAQYELGVAVMTDM